MTLAQFVNDVYLPAHQPGWAKTTKAAFGSNLKNQVLKQLGSMPIAAIAKATIVQRLNEMRAAGKAKRTIQTTKWLLSSIFEEAIDNDLVEKTPLRRIRLTNIPDGEETRPLSEEEVRQLFINTTGVFRLVWRTLIGCGLRPGELAALRRNDVGDSLRVDEAYEAGELGPTKTRTVRFVPLSKSLRAELEAHLKTLDSNPGTLIFARPDGIPMSGQWMREQVQGEARAATGIKDLTLRMCRTTFGTLLHGDLKDVQDLMGHATPEMTLKHYKKSISTRQADAVEELDERLTKPALKVISRGRK